MQNEFFKNIEKALYPLAVHHTPSGSSEIAVSHQWAKSIAFKENFFGNTNINREQIRRCLKLNGVYISRSQFLKNYKKNIHLISKNKIDFTYIDLFCGIGGMRQGFDKAGGYCSFSSDIDKCSQDTYFKNYGEYPFGDITKIKARLIPDHDILVAGFPCQPFSQAGKKKGIKDTRGTLFYDIVRILNEKKPKVALLENVQGLISNNNGETIKTILEVIQSIGYHCNISVDVIKSKNLNLLKSEARKMVLSSKDFGIPHNRKRIYIVIWRSSSIKKFNYPKSKELKISVGDFLEKNPDKKYTISDKLWAGHQRRKKENLKNGKGFGYQLFDSSSKYINTISARYYKDGSEALISQENKNPRKLTPNELIKFQGFSNRFILCSSDQKSYEQFGNSVTVPVIEQLAKSIKRQLL